MKKDDNSGVSIKQIMITAMFLVVTTFGGINIYRIVYDENVNAIQTIESASLEKSQEESAIINKTQFESALVENTEDDFIYRENVKYLASSLKPIPSGSTISRGNLVREQTIDTVEREDIASGDENVLLNSLINGIKEIGEMQEAIINSNSELAEKQEKDEEIKLTEAQQTANSEEVTVNEESVVNAEAVSSAEIVSNDEIIINAEILGSDETITTGDVEEKNNVSVVEENVSEKNNISEEEKNVSEKQGAPTEYVKTIDVKATAYCLCKKCCGKSPSNPSYGVTASGLRITPGIGMKVVASDPSVIPLGTQVYIEGLHGAKDYGYAVVADTGSAIKNLKIDLYMDTHQMALNWGVKSVRVYILDK